MSVIDLEHLEIGRIRVAVVKSRRFKEAFPFLRLKYLHMTAGFESIATAALKSKVSYPQVLFRLYCLMEVEYVPFQLTYISF